MEFITSLIAFSRRWYISAGVSYQLSPAILEPFEQLSREVEIARQRGRPEEPERLRSIVFRQALSPPAFGDEFAGIDAVY